MLKFQLHFDEGFTARDLFLKRAELQSLARVFLRSVRQEQEWLETVAILGGEPRVVGLSFCGDTRMRELQKEFRKLDRTTDILSFPARELDTKELAWLPASERSLGDLVVSLPAVERGAKRGRRSARLELAEVLVHGLLHLLGCDHVKTRSQALRMRRLQKRLFHELRASIK